MAKSYKRVALKYAKEVTEGKIIAGKEIILACDRFLKDLERSDLKLDSRDPDFVVGIIEKLMVHRQGEDIKGRPLMNSPVILQPWQIFIVYNLCGWRWKKKNERRFKEALIFIPRKNGKTMFIACLAFALALLERKSGAKIYIAAASLKQATECFDDIKYTMDYRGLSEDFRVLDNNAEHSISYVFRNPDGDPEGSIDIEALAANPKKHDSLNSNIQIVDELHAVTMAQYNRFKVLHTSRNSIYLIYKNMPLPQILLNFPFLLAGWLIKAVFFARRGYLREYMRGSAAGLSYCRREKKVKFERRNLIHYGTIQAELWLNLFRRFVS